MVDAKYQIFHSQILYHISDERVFTDPLHTLAYGTDASFYRLIPKIVIKAINEWEVQKILELSSKDSLSVTFRAAGTSLSGQAISDSILVICSFGWRSIQIEHCGCDDASSIKLAPGVVGAEANTALKFFGRKIGPDPASINAAQIGGIVANNASGMCCGIDYNSYKTLKNIRVIFQDGTILDTSSNDSIKEFKKNKQVLIAQIQELIAQVNENDTLYNLIQKKYSIKNTTGFSLNALIDFEDIIDVIAHLFIGSEGTLGFISSVTFHTIEEPKIKASSLILFEDIYEACKFVGKLKSQKNLVNAAELMDRASLRSVENKEDINPKYKLLGDDVASILVEVGAMDKEELAGKMDKIIDIVSVYKIVDQVEFFDDEKEYSKLWAIRKGTFPTVGAMRESGTTTIIEDVAFSVEDLADGVVELQRLFEKYNYSEAIIFGHALEGNVHFVFNQDFSNDEEVKRYENFMDDVCATVALKYHGSLKAEHGTGRNMAPFVEMEWGSEAYKLMKNLKNIFDPHNLLNPGVIINSDPKAHLKDLKFMPTFNDIADKCIECGFCEPICPSKDLTLTPRQRIAVNREIQRRKNNKEDATDLEKLYLYDGEETCAVDGLCATSCPVGINTGDLTKDIRDNKNSNFSKKVSRMVANSYGVSLSFIKLGFRGLNLLESVIKPRGMRKIHDMFSSFPYWYDSMPRVASFNTKTYRKYDKNVVYFSSCINKAFGASKNASDKRDVNQVVESLLSKAKYNIIYPHNDKSLCCGVPFESKGFKEEADEKLEALFFELFEASNYGEYPILCDNSPCTYRMLSNLNDMGLSIYEPIEFSLKYLVPNLNIKQSNDAIVIHTTCSSKKMKLEERFLELSHLLSNDVLVPKGVNCCGFAGDRGFHFPELNKSALQNLEAQVKLKTRKGFSTSKTCEIGLSHHANVDYSSILYLLDRVSDAKTTDNFSIIS